MSENEIKLRKSFSEILALPVSEINDEVAYNHTAKWDSVAHMALVAAIESNFDIMMDTDDVIDMSTFRKAKEIVSKYGVAL